MKVLQARGTFQSHPQVWTTSQALVRLVSWLTSRCCACVREYRTVENARQRLQTVQLLQKAQRVRRASAATEAMADACQKVFAQAAGLDGVDMRRARGNTDITDCPCRRLSARHKDDPHEAACDLFCLPLSFPFASLPGTGCDPPSTLFTPKHPWKLRTIDVGFGVP